MSQKKTFPTIKDWDALFLFMKEQECFYGGGQFLVIIGNSRTWEKANYKGYLYLEEENAFYEILQ